MMRHVLLKIIAKEQEQIIQRLTEILPKLLESLLRNLRD